jgi:hypothetical protein
MAVLLEFFKRVNANSGAVRSRLKLLARLLGNSPDFFLPVEEVHHLCSIISSKMISLSDRREAPDVQCVDDDVVCLRHIFAKKSVDERTRSRLILPR